MSKTKTTFLSHSSHSQSSSRVMINAISIMHSNLETGHKKTETTSKENKHPMKSKWTPPSNSDGWPSGEEGRAV